MRIKNLIYGDIHFQFKYGFYLVYLIFTIFYICLLFAFPEGVRSKVATLMIYTDPAAMGLFFMGAIVLFEKSQRVMNSIAVSPVSVAEYIISKVISLGIIGTIVGSIIALASGADNILSIITGIFLGSVIFSLFGLMVASLVSSLNQFMVATIPFEILCMLPPMIYLFGFRNQLMLLHPGCIVIRLLEGEGLNEPLRLLYLCLWIIGIYLITYRIVQKMFASVGGAKL
ncbi:MAG TPA: ABC transporter permease [Mobilitalea sp.]|nr:ABC transporter permease [Mobilitalea sp.]